MPGKQYQEHKFNLCGRGITIAQYRELVGDNYTFPVPYVACNKLMWVYPKSMCERFEETTEDVLIDEDGNRCCVMCSKITDEENGDSDNACAECN